MLIEGFYKVNSVENTENGMVAAIHLNKEHDIFKGHFPGNPVTPGVCMIQIIKELTEEFVGKKLFLTSCSNIKFMAIINPEKTPDLNIELTIEHQDNDIKVKNNTFFGDTNALKMSATFNNV